MSVGLVFKENNSGSPQEQKESHKPFFQDVEIRLADLVHELSRGALAIFPTVFLNSLPSNLLNRNPEIFSQIYTAVQTSSFTLLDSQLRIDALAKEALGAALIGGWGYWAKPSCLEFAFAFIGLHTISMIAKNRYDSLVSPPTTSSVVSPPTTSSVARNPLLNGEKSVRVSEGTKETASEPLEPQKKGTSVTNAQLKEINQKWTKAYGEVKEENKTISPGKAKTCISYAGDFFNAMIIRISQLFQSLWESLCWLFSSKKAV